MTPEPGPEPPATKAILDAWDACFRAVVEITEGKVLEHKHLRLHEHLIAAEAALKGVLMGTQDYELTSFLGDFLDFAGAVLQYLSKIVFLYSYERQSGLRSADCDNDKYYGFLLTDFTKPTLVQLREGSIGTDAGVPYFAIEFLSNHLVDCNLVQRYLLREKEGIFQPDYTIESVAPSRSILSDLSDSYQWAIYGYQVKAEYGDRMHSPEFQTALRACFLFHIAIWNSYLKSAHERAIKMGQLLPQLRTAREVFLNSLNQHASKGEPLAQATVASLQRNLDTFLREFEDQAIGEQSKLGKVLPMPVEVFERSPFFTTENDDSWGAVLHGGPQTAEHMLELHDWLASLRRSSARMIWNFYDLCGGPRFAETLRKTRVAGPLLSDNLQRAKRLFLAIKLLTRRVYVLPSKMGDFDGDRYSLCLDQVLLALLFGLDKGVVPCQVYLTCKGSDGFGGCVPTCGGRDGYCYSWASTAPTGRLEEFVLHSGRMREQDRMPPPYHYQSFDPRAFDPLGTSQYGRFDEILFRLRCAAEVGGGTDLRSVYVDWRYPSDIGGRASVKVRFEYGRRLDRKATGTGLDLRFTALLLNISSESSISSESGDNWAATSEFKEISANETHIIVTLYSLNKAEHAERLGE